MFQVIDMPTLTVVSTQRTLFGAVLAANNHVGSREGHTYLDYLNATKGAYIIRQDKDGQRIVWNTWDGAVS